MSWWEWAGRGVVQAAAMGIVLGVMSIFERLAGDWGARVVYGLILWMAIYAITYGLFWRRSATDPAPAAGGE